MEIQDGIIQMTIEDFKQIIKEEVAKQKNISISSNNLFNEVSLDREDLLSINKNHKISNVSYRITNSVGHPIWVRELNTIFSEEKNKNELGEPTHDSDIWASEIHDLIRKLTLSIFGVKKNKDLKKSDYEQAQSAYNHIKDLVLVEYDHRLTNIERNI